jgi:hypothetical protein
MRHCITQFSTTIEGAASGNRDSMMGVGRALSRSTRRDLSSQFGVEQTDRLGTMVLQMLFPIV